MREGLREVTIQFYPDSRLGSLPISVYTIIAVLISSYLRLNKATATHSIVVPRTSNKSGYRFTQRRKS